MPNTYRAVEFRQVLREGYPSDIEVFLKARSLVGERLAHTLRRLLGMPPDNQAQFNKLQDYLKSFEFLASRTLTRRYLGVLGVLYAENPELFTSGVATISQGRRLYFARSAKVIEESGTLPGARRVPGSPFWTLTNISTARKEHVLKAALDAFHYRPITKRWVTRQLKSNLKERKKRVARKAKPRKHAP